MLLYILFGYTSDEIYLLFKKYSKKLKYIDFSTILKLIFGIITQRKIIVKGLSNISILEKLINNTAKLKGIENIKDISTTLLMPSVNLQNGSIYVFSSTNIRKTYSDDIIFINDIPIGKAVSASCAYPGIFSPVKFNDVELVDGGIRENVPWKLTKEIGADKVISILFNPPMDSTCCKNLFDVIDNSFGILTHELSNYELYGSDYLLRIDTPKTSLLDTKKVDYLYTLGYNQTKKEINKIKEFLY